MMKFAADFKMTKQEYEPRFYAGRRSLTLYHLEPDLLLAAGVIPETK